MPSNNRGVGVNSPRQYHVALFIHTKRNAIISSCFPLRSASSFPHSSSISLMYSFHWRSNYISYSSTRYLYISQLQIIHFPFSTVRPSGGLVVNKVKRQLEYCWDRGLGFCWKWGGRQNLVDWNVRFESVRLRRKIGFTFSAGLILGLNVCMNIGSKFW